MKSLLSLFSRQVSVVGFATFLLAVSIASGQERVDVSSNKKGIVSVSVDSLPVLATSDFGGSAKGSRSGVGERLSVARVKPASTTGSKEFDFCSTPNSALDPGSKATGSLGCGRQGNNIPCYWTAPIILVGFINGTPELKTAVREVIAYWTVWANVAFVADDNENFKGDSADIKILFNSNGRHNSILGVDAWHSSVRIGKNEPTMNLGFLDRAFRSADGQILPEFRRVVLHEFGHAMGLEHEHQNPSAGIKWNRDAVIAELGGPPNNWDVKTVEQNVLNGLDRTLTQFTRYDPSSIMQYSYPARWTVDGVGSSYNTDLSETDKSFIAEKYPRKRAAIDSSQYYRLTTWNANRRTCLGVGERQGSEPKSYFPYFYACDGSSGQQWKIAKMPSGDYRLTNALLGDQLSMSDPGVEYYTGMSASGNYRNQFWTITTLGRYMRLSSNLNGVLYSLTTATKPDTRTHMSQTGHWSNQLWELIPAGKIPR